MSRLGVALATALVGGCIHVHVQADTKPRGGGGLIPGDRVVTRLRGEFREATVITVDGALVTVAWDLSPPDRSQLPRNWIIRLDQRGEGKLARGDWRLCPSEDTWVPCRAEASGQGVAMHYADGTNRTLPPDQTLPIPDGLTSWARHLGTKELDHAVVTVPTAVTDPGTGKLDHLSPRSAGRPVLVGARVLARWSGGGWWEATVSQVSQREIVVSWADGSAATPVSLTDVAPMTTDTFGPGDLGLCRTTDTQWHPARIIKSNYSGLDVIFADGTLSVVQARDCIAASAAKRT